MTSILTFFLLAANGFSELQLTVELVQQNNVNYNHTMILQTYKTLFQCLVVSKFEYV